jgi:hypothetical protein
MKFEDIRSGKASIEQLLTASDGKLRHEVQELGRGDKAGLDVVLSFYAGDQDQAERWCEHVRALGHVHLHRIILLASHKASASRLAPILTGVFETVTVIESPHHESGWPASCNCAFDYAVKYIFNFVKRPFLWMEPDAVPMRPTWLDEINNEYRSCGKAFMGDFVDMTGVENGQNFMSGIGVYHWNVPALAPACLRNKNVAWDLMGGPQILRNFHHTDLIQHVARNKADYTDPDPKAAVFHSDKTGRFFAVSPYGVQGDPATGLLLPHETMGDTAPPSPKDTIRALLASLTPEEVREILYPVAPVAPVKRGRGRPRKVAA